MEILKFNASGRSAFFRNNEVNDGDITFSYGHIHKVAVLGMLGAILGLKGHSQAFYEEESEYIYPEFYRELKDIKISIVPKAKHGFFRRNMQEMVNTCGYSQNAQTKKGQTLMYSEQWIENASWDIYINLDTISDDELREKLVDYIQNNKSVYLPYLGKTNHPACIYEVEILKAEECNNSISKIDSFFIDENITKEIPKKKFKLKNDKPYVDLSDTLNQFEYKEVLPVSYTDNECYYVVKPFVFSNMKFNDNNSMDFLTVNGLKLFFF